MSLDSVELVNKAIAEYGSNAEKLYEIHTTEHRGLKPHYHRWHNGRPSTEACPLTPQMQELLRIIRNLKK